MKYIWEESDIKAGLKFINNDNGCFFVSMLKDEYFVISDIDAGLVVIDDDGNYLFDTEELCDFINKNNYVPYKDKL